MMSRLREGQQVDADIQTPVLDLGDDEIGQVARAFTHAQAVAVNAAVTEARTRQGVRAIFLNIAHRSQVIVHRQLEILDEVESKQDDPVLLDVLFRLDHLATRERRNAENLISLAGGQAGRRWRNPVQVIEVVRSAVGETSDYARVKVARLPNVMVVGSAVADIVHLLAELVDNATQFSPPQSEVAVRGNVVGKGMAIEIVDQGIGIAESELDRLNNILRNPPDFGIEILSDDFRLGTFVVAQLAARNGISVRLTESEYGGVRAIVLVPNSLIVSGEDTSQVPSDPGRLEAEPFVDPVAAPPQRRASDSAVSHRIPLQTFDEPAALESPGASAATAPRGPHHRSNPRLKLDPQLETGFSAGEFACPDRTGSDAKPPLPRRRRQASLAPELANGRVVSESSYQPARSAEQARYLFSAIENGTRQGRQADAGPSMTQPQVFSNMQEGDSDHLECG